MTYPYAPGTMPGQPMPAGQFYAQPQQLPPGVQPQPGYAPPPQAPQWQPPPQQPQAPQAQPPQSWGVPGQAPQAPQWGQQRFPNDASVPEELRGRTFGEAMRFYGIMREDFMQRRQQERQQPQGAPQQPQAPAAPHFQQPGQQPQAPDPVRQAVAAAIAEALPQALAPANSAAASVAYQQVASRFPDWRQHEAEIMEYVRGADPAQLASPRLWETAYDLVRGQKLRGQPQAPPQQPYYSGPPAPSGWPQQPPAPYPPQAPMAQPWGQPPQAPQQYFSESPTPQPPAPSGPADPRDEMFAQRFNLPLDIYRMAKQNPEAAAQQVLAMRRANGQPPAVVVAPPGQHQGFYQPPPGWAPGQGPPQLPYGYNGMTQPNGGYYGR